MPALIEQESHQLQFSFGKVLGTLSEGLRTASGSLLQRCHIGSSQEMNWNARFRPLTLLYPLLEAEAFPEFDPAMARRLTVAHECLIVYGFLDDRLRDKQMEFDEDELGFMRALVNAAVVRLVPEGTESVPPDLDVAVKAAMETYRDTQAVKYAPPGEPFEINGPRVREILGGRALFGYISTIALTRLAECTEEQKRAFRDAFDWLATALQWVDDIQDIAEDLALGEENLVLRLALERGYDAYREIEQGASARLMLLNLAERGFVSAGARHAREAFEASAKIQGELGNLQLRDLLIERTALMDRLEAAASGLASGGGGGTGA